MKHQRSICWLRRDLRLHDHRALQRACENSREVVLVFVFDKTILSALTDKKDRRLTFIYESLKEIDEVLRGVDSRLVVETGDPIEVIPALSQKLKADAVYANHDYEPYAKSRDEAVRKKLNKLKVEFLTTKDQVIFERDEILNQSGQPFRVFTPYKRAWMKAFEMSLVDECKVDRRKFSASRELLRYRIPTLEALGFESTDLWLAPGTKGAKAKIKKFVPLLKDYEKKRDFPIENGTSGLSVHLRFGTISIRELVKLALLNKSAGAETWLSELIWREFYFMILDRFPHVAREAFRPEYKNIKWPGTKAHFVAWCNGRTGFPIVDAGMRQLNQTGFMHNRLRMIVASFLVKDLLIDWKWGEQYFANKLLDFDLAANNGGWQWCASTGCDAQPYFRIFNPISQSQKFDPKGEFIRQYVPELSELSGKEIHWPHDGARPSAYPAPIVHHGTQRLQALKLYKKIG